MAKPYTAVKAMANLNTMPSNNNQAPRRPAMLPNAFARARPATATILPAAQLGAAVSRRVNCPKLSEANVAGLSTVPSKDDGVQRWLSGPADRFTKISTSLRPSTRQKSPSKIGPYAPSTVGSWEGDSVFWVSPGKQLATRPTTSSPSPSDASNRESASHKSGLLLSSDDTTDRSSGTEAAGTSQPTSHETQPIELDARAQPFPCNTTEAISHETRSSSELDARAQPFSGSTTQPTPQTSAAWVIDGPSAHEEDPQPQEQSPVVLPYDILLSIPTSVLTLSVVTTPFQQTFRTVWSDPIGNIHWLHQVLHANLQPGEFRGTITDLEDVVYLGCRMSFLTLYLSHMQPYAMVNCETPAMGLLVFEQLGRTGWVAADLALVELGVLDEADIALLYGVQTDVLASFARSDPRAVKILEAFYDVQRWFCHSQTFRARAAVATVNTMRLEYIATEEHSISASHRCQVALNCLEKVLERYW